MKCQRKVREFDFGQNFREMSGNFVSDCQNCVIYMAKADPVADVRRRVCGPGVLGSDVLG